MADIERVVHHFYKVRDVPYKLGLDGNPNSLLSENLGNCTRKCLYLASELEEAGYGVMLALVAFSWTDLLPQFSYLLADPTDTHMALLVKPPHQNEWLEVDPSWDSGMATFGFPVSQWDGLSGTGYGVLPISDRIPTESVNTFKTRTLALSVLATLRSKTKIVRPTPFNDAVNDWLGRS